MESAHILKPSMLVIMRISLERAIIVMKTSIAIRRSVRVKFKTDTILEICIGNSQTGEMDLYWLDVSGIFPQLTLKSKIEGSQNILLKDEDVDTVSSEDASSDAEELEDPVEED